MDSKQFQIDTLIRKNNALKDRIAELEAKK